MARQQKPAIPNQTAFANCVTFIPNVFLSKLTRNDIPLHLVHPSFATSNTSGDSYSSIEYNVDGERPNEKNPFGNPPYPGDTYAGGPNWVGYLATDYVYENSPFMVFDYAVCGHVVQRMRYQVTEKFLPHAGRKQEWAPWESSNSLFSCTVRSMANCSIVDWCK
jgi:hypothetical protein